jgi:hypothetical protein
MKDSVDVVVGVAGAVGIAADVGVVVDDATAHGVGEESLLGVHVSSWQQRPHAPWPYWLH